MRYLMVLVFLTALGSCVEEATVGRQNGPPPAEPSSDSENVSSVGLSMFPSDFTAGVVGAPQVPRPSR